MKRSRFVEEETGPARTEVDRWYVEASWRAGGKSPATAQVKVYRDQGEAWAMFHRTYERLAPKHKGDELLVELFHQQGTVTKDGPIWQTADSLDAWYQGYGLRSEEVPLSLEERRRRLLKLQAEVAVLAGKWKLDVTT